MTDKNGTPASSDAKASCAGADLEHKIRSHGLVANGIFRFKASGLALRRRLHNALGGIEAYAKRDVLQDEPVISKHEGSLWNADDNPRNWRLTAGKVHNLRTAAGLINGIEIPAGATFSFWAHIGKPSKRRGFVVGRAVREGCIVPTVAGGLCQLSNALYDAALNAGFEIIERHRHSEVIKGSLAEQDRDATIKWNYLDLRFRSSEPFRIEAELTESTLQVRFKGAKGAKPPQVWQETIRPASSPRDCYSCGQTRCASHTRVEPVAKRPTAFLLDEMWPEYDGYLRKVADGGDHFFCPVDSRVIRRRGYAWNLTSYGRVTSATLRTLLRALAVRRAAGQGGRVLQSRLLAHDRALAHHYLRRIPAECTHLVVAQNLLPHLWEAGAFGGRSFDVMMVRLPLEALQDRLDFAYSQNQRSPTLNDFRVPEAFVALESRALERARHILTPHREIASMFKHRAIPLAWHVPVGKPAPASPGTKVLLAAPPLGRKGIYEVERLAEELGLAVLALRGSSEGPARKHPLIEKVDAIPYEDIGLVLLPAYVEHKPRIVLRAVAMGIPAIASEACGLQGIPGVTTVPTGDYESLKQAVVTSLAARASL